MNSRYFFTPELVCNSGFADAISSISPMGEDHTMDVSVTIRNRTPTHGRPSSFLTRMAMKLSRSRFYSFLRRVFRYQSGLRTDPGSNPLNSRVWMLTELIVLVVQISIIGYTLANSKNERPVWLMRIWVSGYGFGCVLSLLQLCWRFVFAVNVSNLADIEHHRSLDDPSRYMEIMNRYRTFLELFFAIWFVIGNVWAFDSRFGSFNQAPKLHILCISLLTWNAISYSFPFILFVLLCVLVPFLSTLTGYNVGSSANHGALDEQLSELPSWKYKEVDKDMGIQNHECCICLAMYKDKEELRQLPCLHIFHLKCIDQWLKIISCCPLCKQDLQSW